ncbi:MAG: apolipoprotein N-acyltransferase [Cryomorphaceae bacterium]|nr:apolipoprotein N-acyltransferase [Cryomorphaceae bacterium]
MSLSRRNRFLLSVLSGVLLTLSFPFTGSQTWLIFVAWIPLLLVEDNILRSRYRSSKVFIHAYLTFIIFNIGTTWWIWNASPGGAIMAFILNALLMALSFQTFHVVRKKLSGVWSGLILVSIWGSFEYLHHRWELSWPWLSMGNFFSIRTSWVQWYSFTGIAGGTLWVMLVNHLGFVLVRNWIGSEKTDPRFNKNLILLTTTLIAPILLSVFLFNTYVQEKQPLEVVAVQPNIDPYKEKFTAPLSEQLVKIIKEAEKKITPNTALVLAPETALSNTFIEQDLPRLDFFNFLKERIKSWKKASLFTGASTAEFFELKNSRASVKLTDGPGFIEYYNSSLLIGPDGGHRFLHKSKLVLGVEKVPFSDWIPFLEELSINNGGTSGTLGIEKEPKTLETNLLEFAPLICYESIYGEFCGEQCRKGAEAIFVITNDGWWGDTPGYKQHMSFSQLRAVENRRCVVRSANTGISCFIDQKGEVQLSSKWWQATALRHKIDLNSKQTFYTRIGDLVSVILLCIASGLILATLYTWIKKTYF